VVLIMARVLSSSIIEETHTMKQIICASALAFAFTSIALGQVTQE